MTYIFSTPSRIQQGFALEKHKLFMEKKTFIINGKKWGAICPFIEDAIAGRYCRN